MGRLASAPLRVPLVGSPEDFRIVRTLLARSRYSYDSALWRLWRKRTDTEHDAAAVFARRVDSLFFERVPRPMTDPLDALIWLFMVQFGVPQGGLTRVLHEAEITALSNLGLIHVKEGLVTSPFEIAAIEGLYYLSDPRDLVRARKRKEQRDDGGKGAAAPNPLVMPAYPETYFFAQKVQRHPVERTLDLCTGGGVHALLAARVARQAVGCDISERAIQFARWSSQLNALGNVTFHAGSLFEPVAGQQFDRITANPPYQPDSRHAPGRNWWGAGPRGDGVLTQLLRDLPRHLAPGGVLQMVTQVLCWQDGTFPEQVQRHLGPDAPDFELRIDADEIPLARFRDRYPKEPLEGLVRARYGVVTLTRVRAARAVA